MTRAIWSVFMIVGDGASYSGEFGEDSFVVDLDEFVAFEVGK